MISMAPFVLAMSSLISLPVRELALSAKMPTFPWRRRAYFTRAT